ncbi:MAG: XrtA-associated tyrosine autokinase [Undibacterium sp.]|uniref:XrtA-associated tyrosine autokinase n=1 Tax=Undibacterium sp. TaxID=1914977 RepID=UPI00271A10B6|nr:XrtA-associated tyrosine autokinase [Undibacterium sp.]MDO8651339.1 XrtA-associated tyrosine autokinase [Undibacterium sp.]
MSIIEKAISRLEPGSRVTTPPEAHFAVPMAATTEPNVDVHAERKVNFDDIGKASTRRVEIDIEQLHRLGMVTPDGARTSIAEEFRLIKRPLIEKAFGQKGKPIHHGNLIMVASSLPREGKTFCAVNLAISMAMELDHTVLLVDADVARPSVPRYLQLKPGTESSEIGLMDVLLDDTLDLADAMLRTNIETLSILRAGRSHHRATELLASQNMMSLLSEIANRYPDRLIIFDSPPLLLTTEARVLASQMGQIVLVVEAESTTQHVVKEVLRQLKSCPNVNLIYNKAKTLSNGDYYGRYYG